MLRNCIPVVTSILVYVLSVGNSFAYSIYAIGIKWTMNFNENDSDQKLDSRSTRMKVIFFRICGAIPESK